MRTSLVVLGGGPGGYAAAFLAAGQGHDVILVEADARMGGKWSCPGPGPNRWFNTLACRSDE